MRWKTARTLAPIVALLFMGLLAGCNHLDGGSGDNLPTTSTEEDPNGGDELPPATEREGGNGGDELP